MARYLVTGGAGFIGSHLCEALLKQGHKVYVIDNLYSGLLANIPPAAEFIQGDIQDNQLVKKLMDEVDGCFHLAAIASVSICNTQWINSHQVNLTGTLNILEHAKSNSKRSKPIPVVFASSAAVYGNSQKLPLSEIGPTQPISTYGVDKLCCEHYAHVANQLYQIPCTALRLFNIYGPRQSLNNSYSGVITIFLNNLLNNQPLNFYGNGEQTRDFVYVKDAANFFIKAMEKIQPTMRIYNVCTGKETSIQTIAKSLAQILSKQPKINLEPPKPGDIFSSIGNPGLIQQELKITAETSLLRGLEDLSAAVAVSI